MLENHLTKQIVEVREALNVQNLFEVVPFGVLRNSK